MEISWQSVAYLGFTVALAAVIIGMAWHYYKGSGRETSETAKYNMMDDD